MMFPHQRIDLDANGYPIYGVPFLVSKSITFAAGTTGALNQHTLFTVTGDCQILILAMCKTSLTSGGAATISMGTANNVTGLGNVITATDIDAGHVIPAGGGVNIEVAELSQSYAIYNGADITYNVLTATITGGQVDFYCFWRPLSSNGLVVAA